MSGAVGTQTTNSVGRGPSVAVDPSKVNRKVGGVTIDWSVVPTIGRNEKQTVTITGSPGGGTFKLSFGGQITGTIAYNADAATVRTALEALSTIGVGNVRVTGNNPNFTVEFLDALRQTDVPLLVLDTNSLTGGSSPSVAIAESVKGRAEADLTLTDGSTIVKAGDKYLEAGTVLVEITATGKYGPFDSAASDGRQTVDNTKRGKVWIMNSTVFYSDMGSELYGDVFNAGTVFKSRVKMGGTGQPTVANVEAALPGIDYSS